MRIREASEEDAVAIARIHVDSWRTTYPGIVPDDILAGLSYERREDAWRATLSNPDTQEAVFVAEEVGGQIVGFASGGLERSGDPVYKGELYAIYLLQEYQGQGLGRELILTVVKRLLQEGFRSMLVWVLRENPSRGFYEKLGGQYVREQLIDIGDAQLVEVAYGWPDIRALADPAAKGMPDG